MHALVFGAGAVGGYLGAKLIQAGWHVTFLGRPSFVQAVRSSGINLVEGDASQNLTRLDAITQWPPELQDQPDFVLVTVKAYDCRQAAREIGETNWRIPIISFINGVGSESLLEDLLPDGWPVVAGTVTTAVQHPVPGRIQVSKARGVGLARHELADPLARAFAATDVETRRYADPASMKWSKLMSNLIGNATAAITGLSVGDIYRHPGLFRLELAALRETREVMSQSDLTPTRLPGVPIGWLAGALRLPARLLQPLLIRAVAGGRGGKRPSMYYDVTKGRTEVDWLNGAVAARGAEFGLTTPANKLLTEQVHKLAADAASNKRSRMPAGTLLKLAAEAGVAGTAGYNPTGRP
ncbi:MAG: ketopantoate reductase family protein [Anaerolineales bacterium]